MSDTNDVNTFIKKVSSSDLDVQNTADLKTEWAAIKAALPPQEQASADQRVQKAFSA